MDGATISTDATITEINGSLTIEQYGGGEVKFLDAKGKENSYVFTADDKLRTIDARQVDGNTLTKN